MSIAPRNSSQFRNDSGELVVFEAARYFSGGDESSSCYRNSSSAFPHREGGRGTAAARMSLDMPAMNAGNISAIQKEYLTREKKKYKQPSSPGGRLASFLNSLFNQANSKKNKKKKKKSKTSGGAADSDEEDCYSGDRRRSSISHIRITAPSASNYQDPNSPYSAAATPPSYAKTPNKSPFGDLKIFSDRRKAAPPHRNGDGVAEIEQFRFNDERFRNPTAKCTPAYDEDKRKFEKFNDDGDDGEDSDSSSDLFDLPNLDFYSRDLPVYGTTDMGRIRIGAPTAKA